MLNRRHIRVKVMHAIYAYIQAKSQTNQGQEKFLMNSIDKIFDLFILQLSLLVEIQEKAKLQLELSKKKHLATPEERNPNEKFVNNQLLKLLSESVQLQNQLEELKLTNWKDDNEYVNIIYKDLIESDLYADYMSSDKHSFNEDKNFIEALFKKVVAPNEKLYDYYEDAKLTWINDYPLVNTAVVKAIRSIKANDSTFELPKMYKNELEDREFATSLFRKTLKFEEELLIEIEGKTPNWDSDRITMIDGILLKMAICELLHFPSIPVKVTINEYLEIAKEYATPKSSSFINGVLDNLIKDYKKTNKLNKSGRGLM